MKKQLPILVCILVCWTVVAETETAEISYNELKIAPENYKSKKIAYSAAFRNVSTTFLPYMEKSGFRPDKYLWIVAGDLSVPAMVKKTDDVTKLVAGLKRGVHIRITGKIKEFKVEPKQTLHARYYVKVENLAVSDDAVIVRERPPLPPRRRGKLRPQ